MLNALPLANIGIHDVPAMEPAECKQRARGLAFFTLLLFRFDFSRINIINGPEVASTHFAIFQFWCGLPTV